jgi:hypothetical protein
LVVIADLLEEAGCSDAGVLSHLREPLAVNNRGIAAFDEILETGGLATFDQPQAVHVRGCWVIDLILGKS